MELCVQTNMKQIYPSRYTNRKVTVAQHLSEKICERVAIKEKIELPFQFWNLQKWKQLFLYQVQVANALLKLYSVEAILSCLANCKNVYSLNASFLDNLIKIEQEKIDKKKIVAESKEPVVNIVSDTTVKPRSPFAEGKSQISKLRDL